MVNRSTTSIHSSVPSFRLLTGHTALAISHPVKLEPMSGLEDIGATAGDQGQRENPIVDDDCRPGCDNWTKPMGFGWSTGTDDIMEE